MQIVPINKTSPTIEDIEKKIQEYKQHASVVAQLLRDVENKRTRIINEIEEAAYTGKVGKAAASRLEDKLTRPYSMTLLNT